MCTTAEYMGSLGVKHALQQPDRDTLIEQSVNEQNTVIKRHFARHNHDIESIILSIIGLIAQKRNR